MNKIFDADTGVVVPDGTEVFEIFGPGTLARKGFEVRDEQSLALGVLPAGIRSKVHVHPIVTHLTYVLSGTLTVKMKDASTHAPYTLQVQQGQSVFTAPGTFFQLINDSASVCRVLYIVGPAFVFALNNDGSIFYNDQIVPDLSWEQLAEQGWTIPELQDLPGIAAQRKQALDNMKKEAING